MNKRYTLTIDPENPGPTLATILENPRANVAGCGLRRVKKGGVNYTQRLRERLRKAQAEEE
ncbi:MAG: hypothetical protein Q7J24_06325 [Desulfomicrobium sp.]|nr:hypothetical protein [Desulfomicrobium sp.]